MTAAPTSRARKVARLVVVLVLLATVAYGLTRFALRLAKQPTAYPGYTLVAPLMSTNTHLIDLQGRVVKSWTSPYTAGQSAYLLEDGHLLRAGQLLTSERLFDSPAAGGHVQEFSWEGKILWDFTLHDAKRVPHHDIARLPSGNILLLVWEMKSPEKMIAAGRRPDLIEGPWLADAILEIQPEGKSGGKVVWEWHAWDHLIQDHDPAKANHGEVASHPERIDINYGEDLFPIFSRAMAARGKAAPREKTLSALQGIGYLGVPSAVPRPGILSDWTHINAVAYNAERDQIVLTVRAFSEFWILDHSTTTAEAASHSGGKGGKGGDLLYRWGNPRAYRAGKRADQRLFAPHDAHWIPSDRPGAGHVLVFNNGLGRPGGDYSSVDEVALPADDQGRYATGAGQAFAPREPSWSYTAPRKTDFTAWFMSGAQRLANGNTLICDGVTGTLFEVTASHDVVWTYGYQPEPSEETTAPGPSRTAPEILPASARRLLKLSGEQTEKLNALQARVNATLMQTLTDAQRGTLAERPPAPPGQILSLSTRIALKLSDAQKEQNARLQGEVDAALSQILSTDQAARLVELKQQAPLLSSEGDRDRASRSTSGGSSRAIFRAHRYGKAYPGLAGKTF